MNRPRRNLRSRLFAIAIAAAIAAAVAGCHRAGPDEEADTGAANPILAVTVARVTLAPMTDSMRILGTTAAMHHVILRAPVAGRVLGMHLRVGDTVRRGQLVAHVLSHEVEAAQQGLEI